MTAGMKPSSEQLRILRHMLGIERPDLKVPHPYRDYYCANKGDAALQQMAADGLVECYAIDQHYDWYRTTATGREAAIASHERIRLPKPKRVYSKFLDINDTMPDLTFKEFLTSPEFAEIRASA